jgi:hypothetical protein
MKANQINGFIWFSFHQVKQIKQELHSVCLSFNSVV